jgi:tRNA dimethylallyltransferase
VKLPPPFSNSLILTGPTASGKTALALELAGMLNAEIIAMDSMTLYRGMDIGTSKPTKEERARVPHHLIDVLDPWESGNVAWWLGEAARVCLDIESRGKQVLFVGGTPFYLKALIHGLFDAPPADEKLRQELEEEAAQLGGAALHARLAAVDPASAQRLHPNDVRRVIRALEVCQLAGRPLSEMQTQGWWDSAVPTDDSPRCLALDVPRPELYDRINRRVESMVAAGWPDEVRRLRELLQPLSKEAAKALGYHEMADYLDGKSALSTAVETIRLRSRQFAKRQLTWLRNLPGCRFVEGKLTFDLWQRKMS